MIDHVQYFRPPKNFRWRRINKKQRVQRNISFIYPPWSKNWPPVICYLSFTSTFLHTKIHSRLYLTIRIFLAAEKVSSPKKKQKSVHCIFKGLLVLYLFQGLMLLVWLQMLSYRWKKLFNFSRGFHLKIGYKFKKFRIPVFRHTPVSWLAWVIQWLIIRVFVDHLGC